MKLQGASHLVVECHALTLSKLLQTSKVVRKHLAALWTLFSETIDPSTAIAVLHALLKCSMRKSAGTFFPLPPLELINLDHISSNASRGTNHTLVGVDSIPQRRI